MTASAYINHCTGKIEETPNRFQKAGDALCQWASKHSDALFTKKYWRASFLPNELAITDGFHHRAAAFITNGTTLLTMVAGAYLGYRVGQNFPTPVNAAPLDQTAHFVISAALGTGVGAFVGNQIAAPIVYFFSSKATKFAIGAAEATGRKMRLAGDLYSVAQNPAIPQKKVQAPLAKPQIVS